MFCFSLYFSFTEIDLNVTCRHLGFAYGNFTYHSFTRNETDYMVFEKPACRGTENSLFECPGRANIKDGARVCGKCAQYIALILKMK